MLARRLLTLSPLVITGFCAAVVLMLLSLSLSQMAHVPWVMAFPLCSAVWRFSLYSVAQTLLNERPGFGRITFPVAILILAGLTFVPDLSDVNNVNDPRIFIGPAGMIFLIISILLAKSALLRTEGRSGWPFGLFTAPIALGIVVLPVGIWFLHPRVETLLRR